MELMVIIRTQYNQYSLISPGQNLKKLIEETYKEVDGEMKVETKVQPENVKELVSVDLTGDNCEEEEDGTVTCEDVKVSQSVEFTANIRLEPEICSKLSGGKVRIDIGVFGQKNSRLSIAVGRSREV